MPDFLELLSGGDRRSIGRVHEVIALAEQDPALIDQLSPLMKHDDPLVRMRAADAVEKLTQSNTAPLKAHKHLLLNELPKIDQQEVQWHIAMMIPRLKLTEAEADLAFKIFEVYLKSKSKIVQVYALQGMADIAQHHHRFQNIARDIIQHHLEIGGPAVKSRARKLLKLLPA